jgi:cytochrome c553
MLHRKLTRIAALATLLYAGITSTGARAAEEAEEPTVESLKAEVDYLRSAMPGQAFAMTQVAYNFSNLWFAVQAENWPLAQFYLNETRVRLRWAMRITPVRKVAGADLELTPIATALENTQLAALTEALTAKDQQAFRSGYEATLAACSSCHATVEKPFLKLQIPTEPAEPLINFAP